MSNGQSVFLGGCLIVLGGILALALGFLAEALVPISGRQADGGIIVGAIAVLAGVFVMGVGWYAMKANAQNE